MANTTNITMPSSDSCVKVDPSTETQFDRDSWIIAVFLAIFAALINNFGLNLQKLAWTKKQSNVIRAGVYTTYWLVGMILIVMASIFDFVALAFGPQSVIAPLGSLTMVSNAFIAPWMHGEKLHPGVIKATAVILVGCVTAVAAADHDNNVCPLDALFALYTTGRFFVYALVVISFMSSIYFYIRKCERIVRELGKESEAYAAVLKYYRISYAALSGLFGAQSVLFARTVTIAANGSVRGNTLFLLNPAIYVVVFALGSCIFLQIYWLNHGLARFESLYNVPIFTSTWIVGTVLGGGVFYGEFYSFTVAQAILFPTGVLLCCLGVFFLAQDSPHDNQQTVGLGDEDSANPHDEENGREDHDPPSRDSVHKPKLSISSTDMVEVDLDVPSKTNNKEPLVAV